MFLTIQGMEVHEKPSKTPDFLRALAPFSFWKDSDDHLHDLDDQTRMQTELG